MQELTAQIATTRSKMVDIFYPQEALNKILAFQEEESLD